jgi:hypothetical protein
MSLALQNSGSQSAEGQLQLPKPDSISLGNILEATARRFLGMN